MVKGIGILLRNLGSLLARGTHLRFNFLEAHHLSGRSTAAGARERFCRSLSGSGGSLGAPCTGLGLNIRDVPRVLVFLIAGALRLARSSRGRFFVSRRVLEVISHLLLTDSIGDLCSVAEKVKVSTNTILSRSSFCTGSEGIVVHVITRLLELVGQAIVCVLEVESIKSKISLKTDKLGAGILFLVIALKRLQLARLCNSGERVIVLEDTLVRPGLVLGQIGVEAEERHD